MTCIVGVAHRGVVTIGGDSAGVAGYDLCVRADEKVFRNGPLTIGFTSSFRMGQLLRFSLKPPDHDPRVDTYAWMCTVFVDAVRKCLKDGGFVTTTNGRESAGTFLVGYKGSLFSVEDDLQVGRTIDPCYAVGCGALIALGSLYATQKMKPRDRVLAALRASERYSAGVRGPFHVVSSAE